jgi:hypothetical protein
MNKTKKGTVPLPPRQCPQRCPICDLDHTGIKSTGFMHHTRKCPFPAYKDVRCLGVRGHKTLHMCKRGHVWGTSTQANWEVKQGMIANISWRNRVS